MTIIFFHFLYYPLNCDVCNKVEEKNYLFIYFGNCYNAQYQMNETVIALETLYLEKLI